MNDVSNDVVTESTVTTTTTTTVIASSTATETAITTETSTSCASDAGVKRFSNFQLGAISNSNYLNPYRFKFRVNERDVAWDGMFTHESVSCIIYHTVKKCIILVRQFRPVVFVNKLIEVHAISNKMASSTTHLNEHLDWSRVHPSEAVTYELCAGICDKDTSLEQTIREEIVEECGYEVNIEDIRRVRAFRTGVGVTGSLHTMFYTEVNDEMKVSEGGGIQGEEDIELFELPVSDITAFINDESAPKPPGLILALMWFLYEKDLPAPAASASETK